MEKKRIEVRFDELISTLTSGHGIRAVDIVEEMIQDYPSERADTLFWGASIYALIGYGVKAGDMIATALSEDIWWDPELIENEQDFDLVKENPYFIRAFEAMKTVAVEKMNKTKSMHKIIQNSESKEAILNLHWRNDSVERYHQYFKSFYEKHHLNAIFVQSSKAESSKGFSWTTYEHALADIQNELSQFSGKITKVCGTSQGGRIALRYAIEHSVDYLGIMPAIQTTEMELNLNIRYQFIIGDQDAFYPRVTELHQKILALGGRSELVVMKEISHYFPDDFEQYCELLKA